MIKDSREKLKLGFDTAFIDGTLASDSSYKPAFVYNNRFEGKKVLSSIEDELLKVCVDKIVTKDLKGNNEPYRNEIQEENKEVEPEEEK